MNRCGIAFLTLFGALPPAHSAPLIGSWDLSPWSGSFASGTINNSAISSGGKNPVEMSLSATTDQFCSFSGSADSFVQTNVLLLLPGFGSASFVHSETFALSRPVIFKGAQHQFVDSTDNGIGVLLSAFGGGAMGFGSHNITIQILGGAIFTAASTSGASAGYAAASGIGTDTLSIMGSIAGSSASATFGGIAVEGPVTGIVVSQTGSISNLDSFSISGSFNVRFKIDSTEVAERPIVKVEGASRRTTGRAKIPLRGTASDANGDLVRVEVRGKTGGFRRARGLEKWRTKVSLKPGRNRIQIRAIDQAGDTSPTRRILVTRE